jgi:hypothetical protein
VLMIVFTIVKCLLWATYILSRIQCISFLFYIYDLLKDGDNSSDYTALNGMIKEWWIGNGDGGRSHGPIEVLFWFIIGSVNTDPA